jgi:hypothetical protein
MQFVEDRVTVYDLYARTVEGHYTILRLVIPITTNFEKYIYQEPLLTDTNHQIIERYLVAIDGRVLSLDTTATIFGKSMHYRLEKDGSIGRQHKINDRVSEIYIESSPSFVDNKERITVFKGMLLDDLKEGLAYYCDGATVYSESYRQGICKYRRVEVRASNSICPVSEHYRFIYFDDYPTALTQTFSEFISQEIAAMTRLTNALVEQVSVTPLTTEQEQILFDWTLE